jgi:hypothetical protein
VRRQRDHGQDDTGSSTFAELLTGVLVVIGGLIYLPAIVFSCRRRDVTAPVGGSG